MHACAALLLAMLTIVAGCDRSRAQHADAASQSLAADVPDVDVRRLPESRKLIAPDVMFEAADRGRALGSDTARVVLRIVADFECAECGVWLRQTLPDLQRSYVDSGRVRVQWLHFPLRAHANAVWAASAAQCASAQGRFWEAAERLLEAQPRWRNDADAKGVLDSIAGAPGVELYALRLCTESRRMWRQIHDDIGWANSAGVGGVPSMVIGSAGGSRVLPLTTPLADLRAVVDSVLSAR